MKLSDYQRQAATTAIYQGRLSAQGEGLTYCLALLLGEIGEAVNKIAKVLRGDRPWDDHTRQEIGDEIGDAFWAISQTLLELDHLVPERGDRSGWEAWETDATDEMQARIVRNSGGHILIRDQAPASILAYLASASRAASQAITTDLLCVRKDNLGKRHLVADFFEVARHLLLAVDLLGCQIETVLRRNLDKLAARAQRGTLKGVGDHR